MWKQNQCFHLLFGSFHGVHGSEEHSDFEYKLFQNTCIILITLDTVDFEMSSQDRVILCDDFESNNVPTNI